MATLNILYEDPHILVCVKPHGIATQSKSIRYPDMVSLIKNHLAKNSTDSAKSGTHGKSSGEPYLAVIHRLDQPVAVFLSSPRHLPLPKISISSFRIRDSGNITGHLLQMHLHRMKAH